MIIIRKLKDLRGAERFGTCMSCGRGSADDDGMMRVTLQFGVAGEKYMQGTSFCVCAYCMKHFQQQIQSALKGENI